MDSFPGWVKIIAQFLPLTHAVALSRAVMSGIYQPGLIFNLLVIIILEIIAFYLALVFMKRRLIK
jgi:lipooligosaccharide transport system permease protein